MTKMTKTVMAATLALSLMGFVSSCEKGPAEKVGEKIDNAVQDTKDAAKDVKDKVTKK
jgi:hypothetical protein